MTFKEYIKNNYNTKNDGRLNLSIDNKNKLLSKYSWFDINFCKNVKFDVIIKNNKIIDINRILIYFKYLNILTPEDLFLKFPKCRCGNFCCMMSVGKNIKNFGVPNSLTCKNRLCWVNTWKISINNKSWGEIVKWNENKLIGIRSQTKEQKVLNHEKFRIAKNKNTETKYQKYFDDFDCKLQKYEDFIFYGYCNKCEQNFEIKLLSVYGRISRNKYKATPCIHCVSLKHFETLNDEHLTKIKNFIIQLGEKYDIKVKNLKLNSINFFGYYSKKYRFLVKKFTKKTINEHNIKYDTKTHHLDHIYSVYKAFIDLIDPKKISQYKNLQILTKTENLQKQSECYILNKDKTKTYINKDWLNERNERNERNEI